MSRYLALILATSLSLCGQSISLSQDYDFPSLVDEESISGIKPTELTEENENSIFEKSLPAIRQDQTIGSTVGNALDSLLEPNSEEEYSELFQDVDGSSLEAHEEAQREKEAMTSDLLAFTIISLITDAVVSFIALAVILQLLGIHSKYSAIALAAILAAALASIIGYYLKALPPNPIGMSISAILLVVILNQLKSVRKFSAAVFGGLFTKLIAGLSVWLVSLAVDALF
ncbi:MAG: hypothetical protein AAGH40_07110 [Verrucomicrobiota bacterium]